MIKGNTSTTGQSDEIKYIEVPEGWKRILENNSINYISPSNSNLKSYENVIEYLKTDGTCKCGLECPFFIHHVFNFDSSVQNKEKNNEAGTKMSACKLCESNRLKGNKSEQVLGSSPLNQTLKHAAKKAKHSTFDGTLTSKKVIGHSRPKLDSPKVKRSKKVSSPLSDIPSPPPIPISSPVQNVPNNLGANQGPLPSFASIVSSSKFFNPGPNRGPLHPTGSLPLKTNEQNAFAFPKPITSTVVSTPVSVVLTTSSENITTHVSETKQNNLEVTNRIAASSRAPVAASINSPSSTASSVSSASFTTVPSVSNVSVPLSTVTTSTVASIINTPTLPSLFSPLDGASVVPNEVVKLPPRAGTKSKPRARPSTRAKPKPKSEQKLGAKSKMTKVNPGTSNTISSVQPSFPVPSLAGTTLVSNHPSSHWPVPASSVLSSIGQTPYHTSTFNPSSTSVVSSSMNLTGTSTVSSYTTGNLPVTKPSVPQTVLPQSTVSSAIYMSQNYQTQGVRPQSFVNSAVVGPGIQGAQTSLAQTSGGPVDGKGGASSQAVAAASMNYPVVATPRIQAQPGMMYVAATPGVNVFPSTYPYVAGSQQQMQISQGSFSQNQNKSSMTVTTMVSTSQQPMTGTQGVSSDGSTTQGKVSFQVPGMYVQGATPSQMFPLNPQSFNMGQYKGAYQLPSTMYQAPMQGSAMAFIAPNTAKGTYPGVQAVATGNIGQFTYQNPFMFEIVMPSTTNQPSSTTVTSTRSSPATSTSVTTSLQMIQPQTLQNPAVAAAFESFVPIAPAAGGTGPRFAQTLAHLASAYNTFSAPGPNASQIQLAYQMMQMGSNPNTAHVQQMAGMTGLITTDTSLKHPITPSVKQGTLTSTATATVPTRVTHVPAKPQGATHSAPSTITTMAQTTREHPAGLRSPFSTANANSLPSVSSPPCTSVFTAHSAASVSAQNTPLAYPGITDPASYNHKTLKSPTRNQIPHIATTSSNAAGICNSPKTSYQGPSSGIVPCKGTATTHESQVISGHDTSNFPTSKSAVSSTFAKPNERTSAVPLEKKQSALNTDQREQSKGEQNPVSYSPYTTEQPHKITGISPRGKDTGAMNPAFEVNPQQHQPSKCNSNNLGPQRTSNYSNNTNLNFENSGSLIGKPRDTKSSVLSSVEVPSSIACSQREGAVSDLKTASRTVVSNDSLTSVNQTNYESDDVNYYATNPLLGMKRSCEAIEVYPDPPERTDCDVDDDDDDDERDDDYCSSNEDILERAPPCVNTPTETVRDLRQQGDNQHAEEQFLISNQVRNPIKEMYNGGCNEVHKEQERKNEHLGVNMKGNQSFVAPFRTDMLGELSIPHVRPHFDIGDVVWAQARGLPSWPGQIVDESKVGKGRADDGKKWVMWFGDHTFSQVEVDRLKTLSEGLRTLDDKTRKKKYRAKKARISMEQAIKEALEELEMRERLKSKQGMRSKAKKKRLR